MNTELSTLSRPLVLGIDGGGSKTEACVARCGSSVPVALGRGRSGPSNLVTAGESKALGNLDAAISRAFDNAELQRTSVACLCMGLAGVDRDSVRQCIGTWITRSAIADEVRLVNDAELLLAEIDPSQNAVALVAGTGSFAFGRSADGRTSRAGGWGPRLGDEGSGYWIGLQSLRVLSRVVDGHQPATALSNELRSTLDLDVKCRELPFRVEELGREGIAALAETVDQTARLGDACATAICRDAARHLAQLIVSVTATLNCPEEYTLVVSGGILSPGSIVSRELDELLQRAPQPTHMIRSVDPVWGAVQLACAGARRTAGQGTTVQ